MLIIYFDTETRTKNGECVYENVMYSFIRVYEYIELSKVVTNSFKLLCKIKYVENITERHYIKINNRTRAAQPMNEAKQTKNVGRVKRDTSGAPAQRTRSALVEKH